MNTMIRIPLTVFAAVALGLPLSGCGGYGGPSPVDPGNASPPPNAIVINVVGINGAQSFSPNPGTVPNGKLVVWHNVDTITHRVVMNDGEVDTGNIAAGAFSAPQALAAPGPYHCTIHPPMVGSLIQ
jgi:plastocyanin